MTWNLKCFVIISINWELMLLLNTHVGSATAGIRANKYTLEIWSALKILLGIKLDQ
jgi:hypothetical protein